MSPRLLDKNELIPYNLLLLADEEMQAIEKYIHQSDVYVVELGGQAIGAYVLYRIDDDTIEVKAIAVDEAYQNQGIGKLMLVDAENRARTKSYTTIIIGTPTIATKQLSIYRKAGFKLYGVRKNFFLKYYSKPIFEDGVQLTDMALLRKFI